MKFIWTCIFLLFSLFKSHATLPGKQTDLQNIYILSDTIKISEIGNVLEIRTLNTYYPTSKEEGIYFLTVQPKYKFGDFSLVESHNGLVKDGNLIIEFSHAQFVPWTVKSFAKEEQRRLTVPDNKPLDHLLVAFSGLFNYFPYQYLTPLLENGTIRFEIDQGELNETYKGFTSFKLEEYTSYPLNFFGESVNIPCIKITQVTEIEFIGLKGLQKTEKNVIEYKRKRTYWVLDNFHDPLILKNVGYRSKVRIGIDSPMNGFQYIENSQIVSVAKTE